MEQRLSIKGRLFSCCSDLSIPFNPSLIEREIALMSHRQFGEFGNFLKNESSCSLVRDVK